LLAIHVQLSADAASLEQALTAEGAGDAMFGELGGATNVSAATGVPVDDAGESPEEEE
ncbi:unnamed protein product, partial [Prorocentrum cordatum]